MNRLACWMIGLALVVSQGLFYRFARCGFTGGKKSIVLMKIDRYWDID